MGGFAVHVVYSLTIGLGMEAPFNSFFVSQGADTFQKARTTWREDNDWQTADRMCSEERSVLYRVVASK